MASRFTFDAANEGDPIWSPDSARIAFFKDRSGVADIFEKPINGGDETLLLEGNGSKSPEDWSRDGRFITYHSGTRTLSVLPLFGERKPFVFLETSFVKDEAQFSPNGRWLAYVSDDCGRAEVYIQPFPGPGQKVRVSTNGGGQPKWQKDGKEIFYLGLEGMLMSVGVKEGETLEPATPTPLFQTGIIVSTGLDQYARQPRRTALPDAHCVRRHRAIPDHGGRQLDGRT